MKPLVSIVLATYFPNKNYFIRQLESINNQTYQNIEVLVQDDSSNLEQFQQIVKLIKKYLFNFPVFIEKNDENKGSNKTFERLTQRASGQFIAYCDQDDVWLPDKIEVLVSKIHENNLLVYSDLSLINSTSKIINKSFRKSNFRLRHVHGKNTFSFLINRNSVTGCAMLINAKIAKAAVPFPAQDLFVHDHWLAVFSSIYGRIGYIKRPLVLYRLHNQNQIGSKRLANINSIKDYKDIRLYKQTEKYNLVKTKLLNQKQLKEIEKNTEIVNLRIKMSNKMSFWDAIKLIYFNRRDIILVIYEIIIFSIPEKWAHKILNKFKK